MSAVDTAGPTVSRELAPSTPRRVWNVVRLHASTPWPSIYLPWLIMLAVFAMEYAIWHIVDAATDGPMDDGSFQLNGSVSWILIYLMVAAVQAMNLTFRFALGLSVTRRDYYLGTSLYFALLSLMYGVGIAALGALEGLTDGWGINGEFFAPAGLADLPWWQVCYVYVLLTAFFVYVGAAVATLYQRWNSNGIVAFFVGLGVTAVGAAWFITVAERWSDVGAFFVKYQLVGTASWSLLPTALAGVFGYLVLRRATPK
ncbi:MAG: hypothetical protein MUP92_02800 [Actinobacteria bacterium]|nr:hypothetical protein [Actinomycetota bacterium]